MATKRPPLDEQKSLWEATLAAEGVTTGAGTAAGDNFIDAGLKGAGANSFVSMLAILYPGQPLLVDSMDITAFDNATGKVTLAKAYKGVAEAIPAGAPYKIVTFRFVPAEVAALAAALGQMDAAATSDDLSDITTTSALAKLRRLLLRFSPGAFSVSIDGSDRTDLDALYTALGVLLGTRDATVSAGVLADTESALALLRRIATAGPVMLFGDITGYTDLENFVVADFIGWEDNFFKGWSAYLVRDDGGAGAIPQGSRVTVQAYTSTTGALVTSALSAAGAIGDQIMLVHPILMDAWNLRGGAETLESLDDELDAIPDMAKVPDTRTISVIGTEETITALGVTGAVPFYVAGIWLGMENMAAGDAVRWRVFVDWDGASIADQLTDDEVWTFGGVQPQKWTYMPLNFWVTYEIAVKATQLDGTAKELHCVLDTGQRGY